MYAKILLTALAGLLFSAMSNPAVTAVAAGIQWNKTVHDFGTLRQGAKVSTTFICYNKSDSVLIFENVQASCGCVIPGWSRAPLKPGDSSVLQVGFDTEGKIRRHVKTIAVYTSQGLFELTVKANIVKP